MAKHRNDTAATPPKSGKVPRHRKTGKAKRPGGFTWFKSSYRDGGGHIH